MQHAQYMPTTKSNKKQNIATRRLSHTYHPQPHPPPSNHPDPYSIREAVGLIKHLAAFPQDGVLAALPNVLGFDGFGGPDLRRTLADVFRRRGCVRGFCLFLFVPFGRGRCT